MPLLHIIAVGSRWYVGCRTKVNPWTPQRASRRCLVCMRKRAPFSTCWTTASGA